MSIFYEGNSIKMKKVLIRIPEEQALRIERLAEELQVSANDMYKFAVFEFLQTHQSQSINK